MRARLLPRLLLLAIGVALAPSSAAADDPPKQLVTFEDLYTKQVPIVAAFALDGVDSEGRSIDRLSKFLDEVRILDTRPRAEYDEAHPPLAVWVDVKKAQEIAARPGGLTDRAAWVEWLTPLGLKRGISVRVVDGARQLEAARVWWLLRYLGLDDVALVDGNYGLWKSQGRPTTRDVPAVPPRAFPVEFRRERLATREDVLATLKSRDASIIDARSAGEWAGADLRSRRGGHVPGACRVEWSDLVDAEGRFLPLDKLKARFDAAGIWPSEAVVVHCQGGGRASVDAFALELLGHRSTRNFYLGWSDWGNAEETPVTTAADPEPKPAAMSDPESKPFTVEYDYKCKWGYADEFLELFKRNHLPVLRERQKQGDIVSITVTKPRIHVGESDRWDFRVTLVFRDAAQAFNIAADEPIKRRLFPDQDSYRDEERRRFEILESHTDLPVEAVDVGPAATSP